MTCNDKGFFLGGGMLALLLGCVRMCMIIPFYCADKYFQTNLHYSHLNCLTKNCHGQELEHKLTWQQLRYS